MSLLQFYRVMWFINTQASPGSDKFPFATLTRVEEDLMAIFPRDSWAKLHLQFIYFGREHCQVKCSKHKLRILPFFYIKKFIIFGEYFAEHTRTWHHVRGGHTPTFPGLLQYCSLVPRLSEASQVGLSRRI